MNSYALHIGGHASRLAAYPWRKPAAHCFRVGRPNLGPVAPPSQEAAGAAMSRPQIAPAVVMKGSRGQLFVFQLERIITPSTRDFRHSFRAALPPQAGVVPTAASLSKAGDNSFLRVAPPLRWRSTWCPDTTHNQANRSPSMRTVNSCLLRWERRASCFYGASPVCHGNGIKHRRWLGFGGRRHGSTWVTPHCSKSTSTPCARALAREAKPHDQGAALLSVCASKRTFRPRARATLTIVSKLGFPSPDRAL